jgi:hypothetical protein
MTRRKMTKAYNIGHAHAVFYTRFCFLVYIIVTDSLCTWKHLNCSDILCTSCDQTNEKNVITNLTTNLQYSIKKLLHCWTLFLMNISIYFNAIQPKQKQQ